MGVIYAPQSNNGGGIGDTIGTLAQLACMVIPGAQVALPFIAAGKAINSAANGNWGGALMNGIGAYNGGQGFNTNFNKNLMTASNADAIGNAVTQASNKGLSGYALGNNTQIFDGGSNLASGFGNGFGNSISKYKPNGSWS